MSLKLKTVGIEPCEMPVLFIQKMIFIHLVVEFFRYKLESKGTFQKTGHFQTVLPGPMVAEHDDYGLAFAATCHALDVLQESWGGLDVFREQHVVQHDDRGNAVEYHDSQKGRPDGNPVFFQEGDPVDRIPFPEPP